jgi:hypothetical protein
MEVGARSRLRRLCAQLAVVESAPVAATLAAPPLARDPDEVCQPLARDPDEVCTELATARVQLDTEGFAIIDNAVEPSALPVLREEARRVAEMARADPSHDLCGGFISRDFEGDFPWSVRGLFAPGWNASCFAEYMASAPVMALVREFLECGPEDLLLPDADCILFINVPGRDRTQAWHRDMRWAGEGGDYSEAGQRTRWEEIQRVAATSPGGHNGYLEDHGGKYVRWALSLVDNIGTGLEIVPRSHRRFRTEFENDCILPEAAKQAGIGQRLGGSSKGMSDGEGGESLIPGSRFVDLKAGQAVLWTGDMLHRGRTPEGPERLTLSCSWSRWNGINAPLPDYRDRTMVWKLDPAVRDALPTEWMKTSWDRWLLTQNTTADRWMGPNPNFKEKQGERKLHGLGKGSMIDGVGDGVSTDEVLELEATKAAAAERVRHAEMAATVTATASE